MSFSRGLKDKAREIWEAGYEHPFVQELGQGTLDREKFRFYLLQDYLYLLEYARVFALGTVKADSEEVMASLTRSQYGILATEMGVHRQYMADFGITPAEIAEVKPSLFNRAYTANMLAVGQTGDLLEILAAVLPCGWTYGDYAIRLKAQYGEQLEGNFYRAWIESYAGDEFAGSYEWFFDVMDELAAHKSAAELRRVEEIFISSVEFEYLFWQMSYHQEMSYSV
jgi:Putative transcription activator